MVVCCGSGGVGKTTTSAALALRAAERGRRVVVLTIDPARRLAQALGLEALGNEPHAVAGVGGPDRGELHAMMLDMRRTFDEMVQAHAPPDRAAKIIANPFYQTISSSFSGTQEYMAMEKLGQLAATGNWDLVVVDTPPSRSALDFLDAPQRMSNVPGRPDDPAAVVAGAGRRPGHAQARRRRVRAVREGGRRRSSAARCWPTRRRSCRRSTRCSAGSGSGRSATYALLRSPGTAFLVVAAPEPDALREAAYFVDRLSAEEMPLAGLVLNRTHPVLAPLSAARARSAAENVGGAGPQIAAAVLRLHADRVDLAEREERLLARFTGAHPRCR